MTVSKEGGGNLVILAVWSITVYLVERGLEGGRFEWK